MAKMARNNNETVSTIKEASKVKTEEEQARSRMANNPATLETRAVDKCVKGKEEYLCTKSVIAELVGMISRNTKFETDPR